MRVPFLRNLFRSRFLLGVALMGVHAQEGSSQVILGQVDDFESGLSGWTAGPPSPLPPSIVADAGPTGAGDDAMRLISAGGGGPGSMFVGFNQSQWTGDFLSAGVSAVRLHLANVGSTDLTIRLAFEGPNFSWYASSVGWDLPAGGGWVAATLPIGSGDLQLVNGTATYEATLGNALTMRILHSASPDFRGDALVAVAWVDNITAVPEPAAIATTMALVAGMVGVSLRAKRNRRQSVAGSRVGPS